jgi:hypothetical protein
MAGAPIPFGQWQHVVVAVRDRPDGSVAITARRYGIQIEAVDTGVGCPPLGGTGVSGFGATMRSCGSPSSSSIRLSEA